jgi:hypothetical protein
MVAEVALVVVRLVAAILMVVVSAPTAAESPTSSPCCRWRSSQ